MPSTACAPVLLLLPLAALRAVGDDPFPAATPGESTLPEGSSERLSDFVAGRVEAGALVGAELHVVHGGRTVLHRAFGRKDRERGEPLVPETIFCVRSMTKPVVGTVVQTLLDERALKASDPVARYLPSFDHEGARAITIAQLLRHRGGLGLSSLLGRDLRGVGGVREVADLAGERGPLFPPGSRFSYSDDGVDTLGAVAEVVTGEPLADLVRERVLEPLGMGDTLCVVGEDDPRRERIASAYLGGPGAWERYWSPADPPLFPSFLASQSLYATTTDYARFLEAWMHRGRTRAGERLVSPRAVRHALDPDGTIDHPCGFRGIEVGYGELWTLWIERDPQGEPRLFGFGHAGSDGTFAWAFPELDLMVLLFTQSRGTDCQEGFERVLQEALLDPLTRAHRAPPFEYADDELDRICREYWSAGEERLVALQRRGHELWAEFPGELVVRLEPTATRDRFAFALAPARTVVVQRDEAGEPSALVVTARDLEGNPVPLPLDVCPRAPAPEATAAVEELARRVPTAEALRALGSCRIEGSLAVPARGLQGSVRSWAEGVERFRTEVALGETASAVVVDGARGWRGDASGTRELEGEALAQARLDHPFRRLRGLAAFPERRPIARVAVGERDAWLVRVRPELGPPRSLYVDAEDGRLLAEAFVPEVPGAGELGVWIDYEDWREEQGIAMPHVARVTYASPLLGTTTTSWERFEAHAEAPAEAFAPPAPR